MARIHVATQKPYEVIVQVGALAHIGELIRSVVSSARALVVTDSNVASIYLSQVRNSLEKQGFIVSSYVFDAGEASKNLSTYAACLSAAADARLDRGSVIVALGGGVVGDLAGFVAATYMRGCHCVQVPTSLLAMVDSSVGGKTAVDLAQGKNLVGTFFQPDAVIADPSVLSSISHEYLIDGLGEVIKYGAIADEQLFSQIEQGIPADNNNLSDIITRCIEIKRDVVEKDERESGIRKHLNFGHTFGHAIEVLSGFNISHGRAVVTGMCLMTRAACAHDLADPYAYERLCSVASVYGYNSTARYSSKEIYQGALSDKKRHGDTIDVVVVSKLGSATVVSLSLDEFLHWVKSALGS